MVCLSYEVIFFVQGVFFVQGLDGNVGTSATTFCSLVLHLSSI